MRISNAELDGRIFSRLREAGALRITPTTPAGEILDAFGVEPRRFWRAVARLERCRELARTPEGLFFIEPRERW